jgi:hypothetical protein
VRILPRGVELGQRVLATDEVRARDRQARDRDARPRGPAALLQEGNSLDVRTTARALLVQAPEQLGVDAAVTLEQRRGLERQQRERGRAGRQAGSEHLTARQGPQEHAQLRFREQSNEEIGECSGPVHCCEPAPATAHRRCPLFYPCAASDARAPTKSRRATATGC